MNKADALTKLCPWLSVQGEGFNNCQADGCMAWQKYESAAFKNNAEAAYRFKGEHRVSDEGYCARGAKPFGDEA